MDYPIAERSETLYFYDNLKEFQFKIRSYFSNVATLKIVLDDSSFVFNDTNGECASTEQNDTTKSDNYDKPSSNDCEKDAREIKKDELKEK